MSSNVCDSGDMIWKTTKYIFPGQSFSWCYTTQKRLQQISKKCWSGLQRTSKVSAYSLISSANNIFFNDMNNINDIYEINDISRPLHPGGHLPPTWPVWEKPSCVAPFEKDQAKKQLGELGHSLVSQPNCCCYFFLFSWDIACPFSFRTCRSVLVPFSSLEKLPGQTK